MKLLEDAINGISLNLEAHDYWTWKLESSGTFSTSFDRCVFSILGRRGDNRTFVSPLEGYC